MDIDTLKLLLEVSRLGSFAAAARARDVDPSWISRIVAQAEHELNIRIFHRTTRRLSLTEAGEAFVRRISAMIDEYDRAVDAARDGQTHVSGTVRITASVAFGQACLLPLLGTFQQTFPQLRIELLLSDANLDFVRDRLDLAIRLGPSLDGDFICSKLYNTRYRVCASPDYLEQAPPLKIPQDLTQHQSLLFNLGDFQNRWIFRGADMRLLEVPVQGNIVISNALCLRQAALDGLGPVLLADWLVGHDIEAGTLVDVFPAHEVTATTFDTAAWLIYERCAFLPARVRRTVNFFRDHVRKR